MPNPEQSKHLKRYGIYAAAGAVVAGVLAKQRSHYLREKQLPAQTRAFAIATEIGKYVFANRDSAEGATHQLKCIQREHYNYRYVSWGESEDRESQHRFLATTDTPEAALPKGSLLVVKRNDAYVFADSHSLDIGVGARPKQIATANLETMLLDLASTEPNQVFFDKVRKLF